MKNKRPRLDPDAEKQLFDAITVWENELSKLCREADLAALKRAEAWAEHMAGEDAFEEES